MEQLEALNAHSTWEEVTAYYLFTREALPLLIAQLQAQDRTLRLAEKAMDAVKTYAEPDWAEGDKDCQLCSFEFTGEHYISGDPERSCPVPSVDEALASIWNERGERLDRTR